MRYAPPPVQYPIDRPVAGAVPGALAAVACASAWIAWVVQASVFDARQVAGAAAVILATLWAIGEWRAAPRGWLSWNGVSWHWRGGIEAAPRSDPGGAPFPPPQEGCDVRVALHLDLQAAMLLRLRPADRGACPRWLWLERRHLPGAWADARRAVLHAPSSDRTEGAADGGMISGGGVERAGP
jgi:hypothetical protein